MTFVGLLNRSGVLQRPTPTRDTFGSTQRTYSTVSRIRFARQSLSLKEAMKITGESHLPAHDVFFESAPTVLVNDRLVEGVRTWRVAHMHDAAGRDHHQEGTLIEVT